MPKSIERKSEKSSTPREESQTQYGWKAVFDAGQMAEGMPPDFLVKLLFQEHGFVRHGQLLMASLWLQSQMVGLISLDDSPDLLARCKTDNGRHLPTELGRASLDMLETYSSETLRKEFERRFRSRLSEQLREDLEWVTVYRDALSHGYVSLRQQIVGQHQERIFWSPRKSEARDKQLERLLRRPRRDGHYVVIDLSRIEFEEGIARVCRLMNFIALELKEMDIVYPVFA